MKLTKTNIDRLCVLSSGERDKIFFDDEIAGFGLRVRKGGSRKWVVHYRMAGLQRRHTIGLGSVLTVEEARHKARKVLVEVGDGRDPAAERFAKRAAVELVFSSVVDDYLAVREKDMKPRSLEESTRYLQQHWKSLHKLAIANIHRPAIAARLRDIHSESGAVAANRARSTLSAMFTWAIGESLCDANPVMGTNKNDEPERERVLTDAELVAIWKAACDGDHGRIVRLLMLTAQRRKEIGGLCWSEIEGEGEAALISLPASRTKNSRPHDVPLSLAALDELEACSKRDGRDLIFGRGKGGFSGWSRCKGRLDEACGVTDWTLHDLRRTAATRMGDLGVHPHVIEAALNHVSGHKAGVAGVYNRSTYAIEKRAALELWGGHVSRLVRT